jgi:amino acid adenylation domain-containing protein/non-ribosomal peptide synthase protein (TIGR01720 family)
LAELPPGEFEGEAEFWARQEERPATRLPTDYAHSAEANTHGSAAVVEKVLTAEETRALVASAPRHLRATVAEVLLASLAEAVTSWTGGRDLTVSLEGHGREPLLDGADLSRTVGWFTSIFPLRVEIARDGDASARLASVKRQARLVPRGGVGYGLLRYSEGSRVASPLNGARPQISLNYLGQFDNSFSEGGALRIAEGTAGDSTDPAAPRTHLLDVVALVVNERLTLRLNYSRAAHRAETIERLAESLSESLKRYARAARSPQPASWVAEDFPSARLEDAELAELLADGEDFEDVWPLSPVQEGMLFHTLEEGAGSGVYVQQLTGELRGELDADAMQTAWDDVLARHPNLRAAFAWAGARRPLQKIPSPASVPFKLLDWRAHEPSEQRQMLERFLREDRAEGFDLRRGPLMRFALVRLAEDAWQLVWTHHHILLDGWSLPLILSQFVEAYRARREGRAPELKAGAPYARYLAWLQRQDAAEAEEFWRGYLSGYTEPTLLAPVAEGAGQTNEPAESGRVELSLDEQLTGRLRDFARRRRLTVNNVIQAAWGFVLCRHARAREVVYGVTVSGRPPELPGAEEMVGLFINTLPLRVEASPGRSIDEWLSSLQAAQSGLLRFQHNRLIDIAGWSEVPRGRPLFDTILVFENYPVEDALRAGAGDFSAELLTTLEQNNYPLTLYVTPGRELKLACAFQTRITARVNPDALLTHLRRVVRRIVEHEGGRVSDLELTSDEERRLVTETWNDTAAEYDAGLLVPERFARAAALEPRKTALMFGAERVSYGELDETSNRLARLLQELGAGPESRVAVLLERTPRMVCALLAVLKAGAAYVPLDPSFPKARLRQIVEEAAAQLIITESGLSDSLPETPARRVLLDREWTDVMQRPAAPVPSEACSQNLAYLIFTSGSTGRPKGVQIPHGALTNALESFRRRPGLSGRDVFAAVTTVSFDIAALELFLPLLAGATLALVPRETAADGLELARLLEETSATAMQATPVTWRMLLAAGWSPRPGFVAWCGGEALPQDLASALLERGLTLWNLYGPTETTIWSTVQDVRPDWPAGSIGRPINNTRVYVLDDAGNPLPPGVAGELYLGGDGLARGYLNLPAMTAEKLVPDPFSKRAGARLYRTGDLAAFRRDGSLEYFGRADLQTKVDGFRIELGDVEAALRALPGVRQAAAAVERDARGANRLVGYLVYEPSAPAHEPARLREMLHDALPAYMVPASFRVLDALPLTPNNKLDRKALAASARPSEPRRIVAPRNAVEEALVEVWKEAFQRDDIGADDDFFDLGGHSLLATQIHVKVLKIFRVEVPLRGLFRSRTVERLAALVVGAEPEAGRSERVARAYLNVRRMSPEERRRRLQKAGAADAGPGAGGGL